MEEPEMKREQLRAMVTESSDAEGSSSFQPPAGTGALTDPLIDTPIMQDCHAMKQYTHPIVACYDNNKLHNFSQSSRDNPISHGSSGNPMLHLPSSSPLGVSNFYVFKSRLQEYAQKVGFSTPFYDTIKEGPSHEPFFRSTVTVNNTRYESLRGFSNRKAAEQSAAEVALIELAKCVDTKDCMFQPVHELGLCKNLIQEYAQKMNYAMPSYGCKREDTAGKLGQYCCSVQIGAIRYIGAAARTKKEAEIKAARTALLAIQTSSSEMAENPIEETRYTVVPAKRKEPAPKQEVIKTRKPKKGGLKKKKFRNKRHKVGAQVENENGGAEKCDVTPMDNYVGTETPPVPSGYDSLDGTLIVNQNHVDTSASESLLIPNLEVSDCQLQKDAADNLASDEGRFDISDFKQCEGNGSPRDSEQSVVNQEVGSTLASNNNTCVEQEGLAMKASATSVPDQVVLIQNEPAAPAVTMKNNEENTIENNENLNQ